MRTRVQSLQPMSKSWEWCHTVGTLALGNQWDAGGSLTVSLALLESSKSRWLVPEEPFWPLHAYTGPYEHSPTTITTTYTKAVVEAYFCDATGRMEWQEEV